MGRKPRNWIGIKMGHVTVVRDLGESSKDGDHCRLFEGICDCGRARIVKSKQLTKGIVKTCGSRKCPYRKPGGAFGHGFSIITGVSWLLTAEESFALRIQPCWYCGTSPKPGHQMGLVRLRDEQPYSVDNCIPCCVTCGNMRGKKMSHDTFLNWVAGIIRHQIGSV
jgi:hypothetical protein